MKFTYALLGFALLTAPATVAQAQTSDARLNGVLKSVSEAYNVDKLTRAKTIRLEEELRIEFPSHDYGPDFHDRTVQRRHYVFDLKNEKGTGEYLTHMGTNNYHGRSIIDQGKSLFIDYNSDTYEPQGDVEFLSEFGGVFRSSDVLLAYYMSTNPDKLTYGEKQMWLGGTYDTVSVEFPNSPPLNVLVEPGTGHIDKMVRTLPNDIVVSYVFDDHRKQQDVTIAAELYVFAGRDLQFFGFDRNVSVNDRKDRGAFEVEKGIVQEPTRVNQEEMSVDMITPDTHYVGQGEAYTVFVKVPSGLLALGTQAGFAERLAAYREDTGQLARLTYAMVVDHHDNAMGGIADAVAEGATLLITEHSEGKLEAQFEDADTQPKYEVVTDKRTIGDVHMVNVPTAHATQVLVAYDEEQNYLYQLLHYASLYQDAPNYAKHSVVTLLEALKPDSVEPKVMLSAASRKPEAWSDVVDAVENYDPARCFRNRRICS